MARKPIRQQPSRLTDPATYAAMDVTMAEAKARFEPQARLLAAKIRTLFDKRKEHELTWIEEMQMIWLRSKFDALSIEYKRFVEPALAARLGPDNESEWLTPSDKARR